MPELFYDFYFRGFAFIVIHRDALTFRELGTALNAVDYGATAAYPNGHLLVALRLDCDFLALLAYFGYLALDLVGDQRSLQRQGSEGSSQQA